MINLTDTVITLRMVNKRWDAISMCRFLIRIFAMKLKMVKKIFYVKKNIKNIYSSKLYFDLITHVINMSVYCAERLLLSFFKIILKLFL